MIKQTINKIVIRRRLNSDSSPILPTEALAALDATVRSHKAKFVQYINPVYYGKN